MRNRLTLAEKRRTLVMRVAADRDMRTKPEIAPAAEEAAPPVSWRARRLNAAFLVVFATVLVVSLFFWVMGINPGEIRFGGTSP